MSELPEIDFEIPGTISVSVPNEYCALWCTAQYFEALAAQKRTADMTREDMEQETIDTAALAPAPPAPVPNPTAVVTPPAPVPAPPAANTQASIPATVELDGTGLPWDARIHSGSQAKMADGVRWKKKRGVDVATVNAVEAELRAIAPTPPAPNVTTPPVPDPAAVVTTPAPVAMTFGELMGHVAETKMSNPDLAAQAAYDVTVNAACLARGVQDQATLAAMPGMVPLIAADLGFI